MHIVYVITQVLVIMIIIIQVIYLKYEIHRSHEFLQKQSIDASNEAMQISSSENDLKIYPVIANIEACNLIYNAVDNLQSLVKGRIDKHSVSLLYICDFQVKSLNVNVTKIGLLALDDSDKTQQLINDIYTNNINYIVVNNKVYMAIYDDILENSIKSFLSDITHDAHTHSVRIVAFFSTKNTEPQNKNANINYNSCVHDIIPFIGHTQISTSPDYLIDVNTEIFNTISPKRGIYIMAYRAK